MSENQCAGITSARQFTRVSYALAMTALLLGFSSASPANAAIVKLTFAGTLCIPGYLLGPPQFLRQAACFPIAAD